LLSISLIFLRFRDTVVICYLCYVDTIRDGGHEHMISTGEGLNRLFSKEIRTMGYREMSFFLLTNSALVNEPKMRGEGGSCGVSANEYRCTQEPK